MRAKWSLFSLLFLFTPRISAQDGTPVTKTERMQQRWNNLFPSGWALQNAGNMGLLSTGPAWNYGRKTRWQTQLMFGVIPRHQSSRTKLTMTLKQNLSPWAIPITPQWEFSPLRTGIYLNTVYGHEFWRSQPNRYPDKYYNALSTKFRLNLFVGQQLSFGRRLCFFYELSTCDLYLRAFLFDHHLKLSDITGLSLGLAVQI